MKYLLPGCCIRHEVQLIFASPLTAALQIRNDPKRIQGSTQKLVNEAGWVAVIPPEARWVRTLFNKLQPIGVGA